MAPQSGADIPEPPSLMKSGAFQISNTMAASSASSSGLVTPIHDLPPSIMGDIDAANSDHHHPPPLDYFDFDLSSFGMEGGLASTGITLEAVSEDAEYSQDMAASRRPYETRISTSLNGNGDTGRNWADNVEQQNGDSAHDLAQIAMISRGQQLHEQLAQFHMQSPAIFAQLSGRTQQQGQLSDDAFSITQRDTSYMNNGRPNKSVSFGSYGMTEEVQKVNAAMVQPSQIPMPTPAQSGEMLPNMHNELVSPLPLGTSLGGNSIPGEYSMNERGDILFTPLLSPAMTNQGGSVDTSPQFSVGPSGHPHPQATGATDTQRQLQAIQIQQVSLQRQLDQLQHQQQHTQYQQHSQMAAHVSPMINPQMQSNYGGALSLSHGTPLQGPASAQSNPQEFFSPLGSPALNPIHHGVPMRARHRSSLSNATSPASLQGNFPPQYPPSQVCETTTVSPALLPQGGTHVQRLMNVDANGQAYLTEWAKLLSDNSSTPTSQTSEVSIPSPAHRKSTELGPQLQADYTSGSNHLSRQTSRQGKNRSPALGPHRSGNSKTRPSPMIKPSQRPGRSNLGGNGSSVSSSPLVIASIGNHQSPAVLSAGLQSASMLDGSTGSGSLSPVDLSAILMPPPPVPQRRESGPANFAPITPATLMQIGAVGSLPTLQESVATPRVTQEPPTSHHTRESNHSPSQNQTPKADQVLLPDVSTGIWPHSDAARSPVKGNPATRPGGVLPPNTLERLRAIRPGAKTTTFKSQNKASPLLQANKNGRNGKVANEANIPPEVRKSSHKQAEQRRRDSLKAGFDELRLLLPPINAEALDPETGEPIPGSSAPRLLPKSSLVPDSNPNKAVSKVALLKYSNEYIGRLHGKVDRRDNYIDLLKEAVRSCRNLAGFGPDEQLDELLDYAFEDEDEDELPTGMAMEQEALNQGKPSLTQISPGEADEGGDQVEGQPVTKRGRRNTVNAATNTTNARGKRKVTDAAPPEAGAIRSSRSARKGSISTPNMLANNEDSRPASEDIVQMDDHCTLSVVNGADCDVDMLFAHGNA